jgi:hypothetical protein
MVSLGKQYQCASEVCLNPLQLCYFPAKNIDLLLQKSGFLLGRKLVRVICGDQFFQLCYSETCCRLDFFEVNEALDRVPAIIAIAVCAAADRVRGKQPDFLIEANGSDRYPVFCLNALRRMTFRF